jgi:predicted GIY-YIG superfamily endonuclease
VAWFYILRLESGALYTGATINIENRYQDHLDGTACRTTRLDPPAALLHTEQFLTFSAARKREVQVKRWTRAKKLALASGDMKLLKALSPTTRSRS